MADYSNILSLYDARKMDTLSNAIKDAGLKSQFISGMTGLGVPQSSYWNLDIPGTDARWPQIQQTLSGLGVTFPEGGTGGTGGGAGTPVSGQSATIDPTLMAFMSKFGVTPGATEIPFGQTISDLSGTAFNPAAATQRGIYSR